MHQNYQSRDAMTTPVATKTRIGQVLRQFTNECKADLDSDDACPKAMITHGPEKLYAQYDRKEKEFLFVFTCPSMPRRLYTAKSNPLGVLDHLYDDAALGPGVNLDTMALLKRIVRSGAESTDDDGEENDDLPKWIADELSTP